MSIRMNGLTAEQAAVWRALGATRAIQVDMVPCRIKKGLYLGSFGAARNKAALKSEKVTHILTVAGSLSPAFPGDFVYKFIDVLDKEDTDIAQYFDECFEFIEEAKRKGGGVLIHCFAGISRSVTIIVAYLMKKYSMSLPKALEHVKEKRPIACPNSGFMKLLQKFEKSLQEMVVTNHSDRIGIHFLTLWNHKSTNHTGGKPVSGESPAAELPTELNTVNTAGGFVNVKPDKLSVCYTGVDLHGQDVGVVQANRAAPLDRFAYYFEIYVVSAGTKGQIAIGFTTNGFRMRRHPGWEANSCGYHGDDGVIYRGNGKDGLSEQTFGPKYSSGDTVGAGVNYASQQFFFTKNGEVVGTVDKEVNGQLFPTIAVHSQNEEVRVNFGKKPFVFDVKAFETQERAKQQMTIEKISVPPDVSYSIIRSYLLHYGYDDTLKILDMASKSSFTPVNGHLESASEKDIIYALDQRKVLRQLIRSGEIDEAFGKLRNWYPEIVQDDKSTTCFLLHCQQFIELVRAGKLEDALIYGRTHFENFQQVPEFNCLLEDCAGLLTCEVPQESEVGYLLEDSHREMVADNVNAMILSTNSNLSQSQDCCLYSNLEKLLRQLSACYLERRSLNGDQGEPFNLGSLISSTYKTG